MTDPFADLLLGGELSHESNGRGGRYQDVNIGGHVLDDKTNIGLGENSERKGEKEPFEDPLLVSKNLNLEESRSKRQDFRSHMNTFLNEVQGGDAATSNAAGVVSKSGGNEQATLPAVMPEVDVASYNEKFSKPPLPDLVEHSYANRSPPTASNVKPTYHTRETPAASPAIDQKSEKGPLDGGLDGLLCFLESSDHSEGVNSGVSGKYDVFSPSASRNPTPTRRSLFLDDLQEDSNVESHLRSPTATSSAQTANVPAEYACAVQEDPLLHNAPHSGSSSRGIDLEQTRQRTALLMATGGNSGTQRQEAQVIHTPPRVEASISGAQIHTNDLHNSGTNPIAQPLRAPGLVDPLSEPAGVPQTSADYYFNDDLLRARVYGQEDERSHPAVARQSPSYNIMERASAVVSAAQCAMRPGDGRPAVPSNNLQGNFDVTFGEGQLGFMLYRAPDGRGVICRVYPNTMADRMNIHVGDVVKGVNIKDTVFYDDVMKALSQAARPVLVSFYRPTPSEMYKMSESADLKGENSSSGGNAGHPGDAALKWLSNFAEPFSRGGNSDMNSKGVTPVSSLSGDGSWKVSDDDLISMRSNFHGTIVHAFEGIFSWSMYGTHEGVDPGTGDAFTEYVMRCQWGPNHKSMTPWMVARRYREFSALDKDLHYNFPYLRGTLPCLPPKELFKTSAEVVSRRKVGLEQYMTFLITNVPAVLTSAYMDRFITISERLKQISSVVGVKTPVYQQHPSPSLTNPSAVDRSTSPSCSTTPHLLQPWTSQQAYQAYQARGDAVFTPLNCDGLVALEDLVRELSVHVSGLTSAIDLKSDKDLYKLVELCKQSWPILKMTAAHIDEVPGGVDLLPRIVQVDADLDASMQKLSVILHYPQ